MEANMAVKDSDKATPPSKANKAPVEEPPPCLSKHSPEPNPHVDILARLKLRAKESIIARRARETQFYSHEIDAKEKQEAIRLTMEGQSKSMLKEDIPGGLHSIQQMISPAVIHTLQSPLYPQMGLQQDCGVLGNEYSLTSLTLDDLIADGKAAAREHAKDRIVKQGQVMNDSERLQRRCLDHAFGEQEGSHLMTTKEMKLPAEWPVNTLEAASKECKDQLKGFQSDGQGCEHEKDVMKGSESSSASALSAYHLQPTTSPPEVNFNGRITSDQGDLNDIELWLCMTGFYDEEYRKKKLERQRRIKAIEEEKRQLLLEEEADQKSRSQPAGQHPSSKTAADSVARTEAIKRRRSCSSGADPRATKGLRPNNGERVPDNRVGVWESGNDLRDSDRFTICYPTKSSDMSKTSITARGTRFDDFSERLRKSPMQYKWEGQLSPGSLKAPLGQFSGFCDERQRYDHWSPHLPPEDAAHRRNNYDRGRDANRNPHVTRRHQHSPSTNFRDRRAAPFERTSRPTAASDDTPPHRDSIEYLNALENMGIDLRAGNVRYFLIRSHNYENVRIAQSEGLWCTQKKNESLLVNAFRGSRHVILIFSINMSKAFQGYAKMQSLPGDGDIQQPFWRNKLPWEATEPFKIKWIAKADTPYRAVGNLYNSLNENSFVFVGRDGQEISTEAGFKLCEIMDSDTKSKLDYLEY